MQIISSLLLDDSDLKRTMQSLSPDDSDVKNKLDDLLENVITIKQT